MTGEDPSPVLETRGRRRILCSPGRASFLLFRTIQPAITSSKRCSPNLFELPTAGMLARGVGQNEESLPDLRQAHLSRRKQSARSLVPHSFEVSDDIGETDPDVVGDVLGEEQEGTGFRDDPPDFGPEVPGVLASASLSHGREWLARVSRSDDIHDSTPRLAVEGSQVSPDRRPIQGFLAHAFFHDAERNRFPFHVADCSSSRYGELESELEFADSGAEGQGVEGGRMIHMFSLSFRRRSSLLKVSIHANFSQRSRSQVAREAGWRLMCDTSIKCRRVDRETGQSYE